MNENEKKQGGTMKLNQFKNAIFLMCLGLSLNTWATPMPDVSVGTPLQQDDLGKGAIRAYQDHRDPTIWYYLPTRFELEKVKGRPSFRHSFFDLSGWSDEEDRSHSYYQFVFVPRTESDAVMHQLKEEIVKHINRREIEGKQKITTADIILNPMPFTNVFYQTHMPELENYLISKTTPFFEYVDLLKWAENQKYCRGVLVELSVRHEYEPTFGNYLVESDAEIGIGSLKLEFTGHFQNYVASANINFEKFYEFMKRKGLDKKKSGWWLWKKEEYFESTLFKRTSVDEIVREAVNAGIQFNVFVDASVPQQHTLSKMRADGRVVEVSLQQHLTELLVDKIMEQAFHVEKVMEADTEQYHVVSKRESPRLLEGMTSISINSTSNLPVTVQGVHMYLDGLSKDLLDPAMDAYVSARKERQGQR